MLKVGNSAARRATAPRIPSAAPLLQCISGRGGLQSIAIRLRQQACALSRNYHDSTEYGFMTAPLVEPEDFSATEIRNRQKNANLLHLVNAYRKYGHLSSNLDPLGMQKAELIEELSAGIYGLTEDSKMYNINGIVSQSKDLPESSSLSDIVNALQKTYCRNIAYEFEHISSFAVRQWFSRCVETLDTHDIESRYLHFHELMTKTEEFELFLQKKLPNVKRYGLEGSESIVVLLDQLIYEAASKHGISEVVAGLSHRGRMSILSALFGYPKDEIIRKLRGGSEFPDGSPYSGDMLVDLAKPCTIHYDDLDSSVNIDVLSNACHLDSGMPVGIGKSRIKDLNIAQENPGKKYVIGDHVLALSVHGDSSFAGQGIVAESLGMAGLSHFTNGGTIHIVLNNQVGYTTPASHTRATRYASDVAKFADIPIIHVNGEHPEDVVIDVWTFRKRGHNEVDEPSFTQPKMYQAINARKSIPATFEEKLISSGRLTKDKANAARKEWLDSLAAAFVGSETCSPTEAKKTPRWATLVGPSGGQNMIERPTGVDLATLYDVGVQSVTPGDSIKVHPRIERFHIKPRMKKLQDGAAIDWATAEALAFGTLIRDGYNVRLCGQDVGRGTFSQRHAMFVCQETERVHIPLNHMKYSDNDADSSVEASSSRQRRRGKLEVVNSNLCEAAAVGFEYGVSLEDPYTLPIWEAQFGDFYNNSQTIVDGYIASGESKWGKQSSLVMLLPHGFDGGGPDHSSSRIERHLLLSNDPVDGRRTSAPNIYVTYPSTPAQFFHLMRRQMKRNFRKPLFVAGPKTLLRLASATSVLSEMGPGTQFRTVLDDPTISEPQAVKRVMIVSGKLYYDLAKLKSEHPLGRHVAIVRVEELSPFPREELYKTIMQYRNASDFVWIQEEPRNAGAYMFAAPRIQTLLPKNTELRYVGRPESAAVCSGVETQQAAEHRQLTAQAFDGLRGLVADLVIDSIGIQNGQRQQLKKKPASAASVISARVPHRWSNSSPMYAASAAAAAQSGEQ
ncbi:hypothetical protein IW140_001272 [Coemansia sp. RSA 1813]|nr:hypothetical protein EV178_001140 [Coemansia sp. RSA 1646]KAJ2091679.1 hypothetical protein IW138_001661 [Coemansia sp. RSA 986]KAJ2216919.1 hypothetical protein EV179_000954 [Coemansia sp. RSA 487]KAJ2571922.1 hypothetical protein IW140_001272 [Coemansia sp. RSA 1813]